MTKQANSPNTTPDKNRQLYIEIDTYSGVMVKVGFYAHRLDVESGLFLDVRDVEMDSNGKDFLQRGFYQLINEEGSNILKREVLSWGYKND